MKDAGHNPKNSHVLVAGKVNKVFRGQWCYGGVAYTLATGEMVYSWEHSVGAIESE